MNSLFLPLAGLILSLPAQAHAAPNACERAAAAGAIAQAYTDMSESGVDLQEVDALSVVPKDAGTYSVTLSGDMTYRVWVRPTGAEACEVIEARWEGWDNNRENPESSGGSAFFPKIVHD